MKTVLLRVRGRVQGVWYRGWTVREARRRGLDGWVRNRSDGSVEALLSGTENLVDEMVRCCRSGPPAASVETVQTTEASPPEDSGFEERPSK